MLIENGVIKEICDCSGHYYSARGRFEVAPESPA
jgi:hypothetical protein